MTLTHANNNATHPSSEHLGHSNHRRANSIPRAQPWSTTQQPSHNHPHGPPDYLADGTSPRITPTSFKNETANMPDDTSLAPRFHSPTHSTPPQDSYRHSQQHPSKQHTPLPPLQLASHASSHQYAVEYPREPTQGSPRLNDLRSSPPGPRENESIGGAGCHQQQHGDPSSQSHSATTAHSPNRRRTRVLMTRVQSEALNKLWSLTMFPSTSEREALAQQIGLTARQVQVWFQNQRQKRRRERESDDAVQLHELPPTSHMHPAGWMAVHGPAGHMGHQPSSLLGLVAHPYHPQPQPYGALHGPHPTGMPSTVPPPADYRHGPSPSHARQGMGVHGASEHVGSGRSWALRSPYDEHPPGLVTGRYSGRDDDSPPTPSGHSSRDSYFGPQRPIRVRSTSHPNASPYQSGFVVSSSSSGLPPSEYSTTYTRVSRTISPSSKSPDPNTGSRPEERYSPMDEMDEEQELYLRGSRSAPARTSDLPSSLSSIVIDSPYASGADPEAATLQPLNLREAETRPNDRPVSPPSWRSRDKNSLRPQIDRNVSGDSEDGLSRRKTVADLLN